MKKYSILLVAIAALSILSSCTLECYRKPKNVIYLIGDGMGFGAVSSLLLSTEEETGFEQAPVIGLSETCSANNYVTDSPAGGTALATGTRTCNGFLGVGPDSVQLESLLKKAQKFGLHGTLAKTSRVLLLLRTVIRMLWSIMRFLTPAIIMALSAFILFLTLKPIV